MSRWMLAPLQALRLLVSSAGTLILWVIWLHLLVLAVYQASIIARREFVVPEWIRARLNESIASAGLSLSTGTVSFDPTGRAVLQDLQLSDLGSGEPLLRVKAAFIELDPLLFLTRRLELHSVEFSGLSLHVPAIRSPSGRNEAVVESVAGRLRPSGNRWLIDRLSGRFGEAEFALRGSLLRPEFAPRKDAPRTAVEEARRTLVRWGERALQARARLDGVRSLRAFLDVEQTRTRAFVIRAELTADRVADASVHPFSADAVRLLGRIALEPEGDSAFTLDLATPRCDAPPGLTATALSARLEGRLNREASRPRLDRLQLAAGTINRGPVILRHATVDTELATLASHVSVRSLGEPWEITISSCDPVAGRLRAQAAGRLTEEHLALAETLSGRPLLSLLQLASKPRLEVDVTLDERWKLSRVTGRLAAGAVTARGVPLDGASASFRIAGDEVRVEDIILRQGPSEARGSYAMDLATRDFRFLLEGRLQPTGISGWFKDWWPRFWANFEFAEQLPTADVDVRGRWGAPTEIRVYVGARNGRTGIRGTLFDSISTQVFVRPHFHDVRHFRVTQGRRAAGGQFSRLSDPASRALARMDFSAVSDLDLTEGARVLGEEIEAVVAPFRMTRPTRLEVAGTLRGPGMPEGERRRIDLTASSVGDFLFHEFPLSGITATIAVRDDDIVADPVATGFAAGQATGRIHLSGRDESRRLGFDVQLKSAVLGRAIRDLEEFSARRNRQPPPQENRFQQRIAAGQFDLALSADGRLDDLFSYQGQGNAELKGADLGEVRLLWVLSELLDKTLLNFSTLKLDTVRANFALNGRKLAFSDVRITGPRAAVEAQGDYLLDRKSLDMKAKLFPFEESNGLFGTAVGLVFSPFSQALELRLTGPLDKPSWAFVFGPTSMLRTLTGNEKGESAPGP